jgi:hypothetical protein
MYKNILTIEKTNSYREKKKTIFFCSLNIYIYIRRNGQVTKNLSEQEEKTGTKDEEEESVSSIEGTQERCWMVYAKNQFTIRQPPSYNAATTNRYYAKISKNIYHM